MTATTSDPGTVARAYIEAVGDGRFDDVTALLHPDVAFRMNNGRDCDTRDDFVAALRRLSTILDHNEIRYVVVDHDTACITYDFVTDTPAGAVPTAEWLTVEDGRIRSIRLAFQRERWPEVVQEIERRQAAASASA
jgi:hypothetical protein